MICTTANVGAHGVPFHETGGGPLLTVLTWSRHHGIIGLLRLQVSQGRKRRCVLRMLRCRSILTLLQPNCRCELSGLQRG